MSARPSPSWRDWADFVLAVSRKEKLQNRVRMFGSRFEGGRPGSERAALKALSFGIEVWCTARWVLLLQLYLASVVVTFQRVRPQHSRVLAVEHSPGSLRAQTGVPAVYSRHVFESEVARRKVEVRRVERHEEGKQLVLRLSLSERKQSTRQSHVVDIGDGGEKGKVTQPRAGFATRWTAFLLSVCLSQQCV